MASRLHVDTLDTGNVVYYVRPMRYVIPTVFGALIACTAAAQNQPDAAGILNRITQTYKGVSTYELVAEVAMRQAGGSGGPSGHIVFAFRSPNQYRMESTMPGTGPNQGTLEKILIVHDGSTVWSYLPDSNEYTAMPASQLTDSAPGDQGDLRPAAVDTFMMWRYRGASDFSAGAKLLRDEAIESSGMPTDCYVLKVQTKMGEYTWWVDKRNSRILREDSTGSSSVFTTVRLSGPLPDDLFKFQPPPGARRIRN